MDLAHGATILHDTSEWVRFGLGAATAITVIGAAIAAARQKKVGNDQENDA